MENFLISFNAVMPLASYIVIGIFITYFKLADEQTLGRFNNILFKVFYPVIMFSNVYKTDFSVSADSKLVIYNLVFIIVLVSVLLFFAPKFIENKATCGSFVQAGYRSNIVLFGIPLAASVFGEESTGMISITAAFIVPLYNVLAVIILEYFRGQNISIGTLIKNVLKNPLIQGAIVGIIYNVLNLPKPQFFQNVVQDTATSTTVFAIIILGASLKFSSLKRNWKVLVSGILLRLIIVPAVSLSFAYFVVGLRGMQIFVTLIVSATPVATSAYTMACNMNGDHEICAQYVAISTVLSVFTIFMWIMSFMNLGLI